MLATSLNAQVAPGSPDQPKGAKVLDVSARASAAAFQAVYPLPMQAKRSFSSKKIMAHVFNTLEDPSYSKTAKILGGVIMLFILLSTITFVLETELAMNYTMNGVTVQTGFLPFHPTATVFYFIEMVSIIAFTVDYLVRLITCPHKRAFILDPMNIVDLVAWLPYWIMAFVSQPIFGLPQPNEGGFDGLGFVRAVRLMRVFRIFKFGKYSFGIQLFGGAIYHSLQPMAILGIVTSVGMILASSIIWLVERDMVTNEMLQAAGRSTEWQAVCYGTIPNSFWWALTTMTTVGYGDCFPLSAFGKVVSVFTMISGVIMIALPITVIGSNFARMVELYQEDPQEYAPKGDIHEYELREFLSLAKKTRTLKRDYQIMSTNDLIDKFMAEYAVLERIAPADFEQIKKTCLSNYKMANPARDSAVKFQNHIVQREMVASESTTFETSSVRTRMSHMDTGMSLPYDADAVARMEDRLSTMETSIRNLTAAMTQTSETLKGLQEILRQERSKID